MTEPARKLSGISAVFPAYNDGGTIASMVATAQLVLDSIAEEYEIIVVNDGSGDYTGQVLDELTQRFQHLRVITHAGNMGYGRTIRDGFAAAKMDWVFYTDGDAQYNPMDMRSLAEAATDEVDIVNGYKISRHDPVYRKWIGRLYHHTVAKIFGVHIHDINCDFRLIRRSALENIQLESDDGSLGLELVVRLQRRGYRFIEVPVAHFPRSYGVSQFFNFRNIFRTAVQILRLWQQLQSGR